MSEKCDIYKKQLYNYIEELDNLNGNIERLEIIKKEGLTETFRAKANIIIENELKPKRNTLLNKIYESAKKMKNCEMKGL